MLNPSLKYTKFWLLFAVLVAFLLLVNPEQQDTAPHNYKLEFEALRYDAEICTTQNSKSCASSGNMRWAQEIRLGLFFGSREEYKNPDFAKFLENTVNDLSDNSGVEFIAAQENINFQVIIVDSSSLNAIRLGEIPALYGKNNLDLVLAEEACLGSFAADDKDNIVFASIYIPFTLTGQKLQKCLSEEMFHMMGLPGDPPGKASLFESAYYLDENCTHSLLAPAHLMMLASHYGSIADIKMCDD